MLRHFPLVPCIKHIFRCKGIANLMSWHASNKSTDGKMHVPSNNLAWKHVGEKWLEFKGDPRHLHLGLASDGVNPFVL